MSKPIFQVYPDKLSPGPKIADNAPASYTAPSGERHEYRCPQPPLRITPTAGEALVTMGIAGAFILLFVLVLT